MRNSRYGSPVTQGYDGVHMRGKQAVQHYTGSVINVISDVMPNLGIKKVTITNATTPGFEHRNKWTSRNRVNKGQQMYNSAQPKFVQGRPQMTKTYANVASMKTNHQFNPTPATGVNSIPVGGNNQYFNLKTQNRFSPVSGN